MKELLPPFSEMARSLKCGIYEHYKKKDQYELIAVGRHSETLEEYVIYRALYGDGGYWIRPVQMFCEQVRDNGKEVPRFQFISSF